MAGQVRRVHRLIGSPWLTKVLGSREGNVIMMIGKQGIVALIAATLGLVLVPSDVACATAAEIVTEDNEPPTITAGLSEPANKNGWHRGDVTVTFTCSDGESGIASCTSPVTINTDGAGQVVTGTATDNSGNTASVEVTINRDTTRPVIDITSHVEGATVVTETFTVSGNVSDTVSGLLAVKCDHAPATVTAGTYSCDYTRPNGPHYALVKAEDLAGNQRFAHVIFTVAAPDTKGPGIMVGFLPEIEDGDWSNTDVTVNFACQDNESGVATCPSPIFFTAEGANQSQTVTATDIDGNSTSKTLTVSIDKTPPTIEYDVDPLPGANGWNTADTTLTFSATDDLSGIALVSPPSEFKGNLRPQTITGFARDRAGNTVETSVTIKVDSTPPKVTITAPQDGQRIRNRASIKVAGVFYDLDSGISDVTCNGAEAIVTPLGFTCMVALDEEADTITVTATDVAGNTDKASVTVEVAKPQ